MKFKNVWKVRGQWPWQWKLAFWHPIHTLHCAHEPHVPFVLKSGKWATSPFLFTLRLELYLWWCLADLVTCIQIIHIFVVNFLFRKWFDWIQENKRKESIVIFCLLTGVLFLLHPQKYTVCFCFDNTIYLSDGAGRSQLFSIKISWKIAMVLSTMVDAIWYHF